MGLELVNPCSSYRVAAAAWEGIEDLMVRVGWDRKQRLQTIKELRLQRRKSARWSLAQIKICQSNLLGFYKARLADYNQPEDREYPMVDQLAQLVFSIHLASAIIETYFSKTAYIKSKTRKSLSDNTVSHVLHVSQTPAHVNIERLPPESVAIDVDFAATRTEHNLDELRKKYVGRKVSKQFNVDGEVVRYVGEVDRVYWEPEMRKFLYHVVYEDSDEEEIELWQLRTILTT